MSQALGSFLIGEEIAEDAAILPLADIRERFPLNAQAARIEYSGSDSDRVRLRHVRQALQDAGLKVSGPELAQYCPEADVELEGDYNNKGQLKGTLIIRIAPTVADLDLTRATVQATLQAERFPVVATYTGNLLDVRYRLERDGADILPWLELGCPNASSRVSLAEVEQWIAVHQRFAELYILEEWHADGVSPQQAAEWVQAGLPRRHSAKQWIDGGIDAVTAARWAEAHTQFRRYEHAKEWIGQVEPEEAGLWARLVLARSYRPEYKYVHPMRDAGITGEHLQRLQELGVEQRVAYSLLQKVVEGKLTVVQMLDWAELDNDFHVRSSATHWQERGISAQQGREWWELAKRYKATSMMNLSSGAADWIAAGRSPEEAEPWISRCLEFWDYQLVAGWEAIGESLDSIEPWLSLYDRRCQDYQRPGARVLLKASEYQAWQHLSERCQDPEVVERLLKAGVSREQAELVLGALT